LAFAITLHGRGVIVTAPITLCIIVRDEEEYLPGCLASVEGCVAEVIVVDTGSRDNTVALAEAAGAKLVHHVWSDNFSAARNAALAQASQPWILLLDADERLAPEALAVLIEAVTRGGFDCGELPLYDAQTTQVRPDQLHSHGHLFKDPVHLQRLFRRSDDLHWQGVIHENVADWLQGKKCQRINAPIVHYGNVPELRESRGKNVRNLKLLARAAKERPEDLKIQAYYLAESFRSDKSAKTHELATRVWQQLQKAPLGHRARLVPVVTIYLWFLVDAGRTQEALAVLEKVIGWGVDHPHLHWMKGICWENTAATIRGETRRTALQRAARAYRACTDCHGKTYVSEVTWGVTSWMGLVALGRICLRLGTAERAYSSFSQARDHLVPLEHGGQEVQQHLQQAQLGTIHALLLLDKVKEAMRALRQAKEVPVDDLALLRADAYERSDNFAASLKIMRELLGRDANFTYSEGVAMFRELLCLVNLYTGAVMAGEGSVGTLAAVLAGKDLTLLNDPVFIDEKRIHRAVDFVISSRGQASFEVFDREHTNKALPTLAKVVRNHLVTSKKT